LFFHTKPRNWLGERLRNDLFCVEWDEKPQLSQSIHHGEVDHDVDSVVLLLAYSGTQMESMAGSEDVVTGRTTSQCLVAIGRLQVTSSPNSNDLMGTNGNSNEFISRHSTDGKFTFVDQRYLSLTLLSFYITSYCACVLLLYAQINWRYCGNTCNGQ